MKYNVYYSYRGERYCGGQYGTKAAADARAAELRADHVYVSAVHPGQANQGC